MRSRFWLRLDTSTAMRPSSERSTSVRPTSDSTTPLISVQRRSSLADAGMAAGAGAVSTMDRRAGGGPAAERTFDAVGAVMMDGGATPEGRGVTARAGDAGPGDGTTRAGGAGRAGAAAGIPLGATGPAAAG